MKRRSERDRVRDELAAVRRHFREWVEDHLPEQAWHFVGIKPAKVPKPERRTVYIAGVSPGWPAVIGTALARLDKGEWNVKAGSGSADFYRIVCAAGRNQRVTSKGNMIVARDSLSRTAEGAAEAYEQTCLQRRQAAFVAHDTAESDAEKHVTRQRYEIAGSAYDEAKALLVRLRDEARAPLIKDGAFLRAAIRQADESEAAAIGLTPGEWAALRARASS